MNKILEKKIGKLNNLLPHLFYSLGFDPYDFCVFLSLKILISNFLDYFIRHFCASIITLKIVKYNVLKENYIE